MILRAISLFALTLPAIAQFDAASILGTVRDVKGGAIIYAAVTLENINTGFTAKTSSDVGGKYLSPA